MKCAICKNGETSDGTAMVALEGQGAAVIIKDVPAAVCDNCGEYCLSEEVAAHVLELAETAAHNGAELEVLRYAA